MPKKHSIEFIREEFRRYGYTLVSTEYRTMGASLEYICDNHPDKTSRMSYGNLVAGTRCRHCRGEKRRFSIEEVKSVLLENDCELVSTVYGGNAKPIEYRCLHHYDEIQTSTLNNIQQRQGCPKCRGDKISRLHRLDHSESNRSEVKRERNRREYRAWRIKVLERDNFVCQCCGDDVTDNAEAHHIESFALYKEKRFDVSNGITMCPECHNSRIEGSFHNLYGTNDNTIEQLTKYFQSKGTYLKGAFSIEENLKGVFEKWQEE